MTRTNDLTTIDRRTLAHLNREAKFHAKMLHERRMDDAMKRWTEKALANVETKIRKLRNKPTAQAAQPPRCNRSNDKTLL